MHDLGSAKACGCVNLNSEANPTTLLQQPVTPPCTWELMQSKSKLRGNLEEKNWLAAARYLLVHADKHSIRSWYRYWLRQAMTSSGNYWQRFEFQDDVFFSRFALCASALKHQGLWARDCLQIHTVHDPTASAWSCSTSPSNVGEDDTIPMRVESGQIEVFQETPSSAPMMTTRSGHEP